MPVESALRPSHSSRTSGWVISMAHNPEPPSRRVPTSVLRHSLSLGLGIPSPCTGSMKASPRAIRPSTEKSCTLVCSEVFHHGHDRARNIGEQLPSCPLVELADHKLLAGHRVRFAETGRIPVGTAEEPGIEDMGLAIVGARDDHLAAIPMLGKEAAVAIG